MCSEIQAITTWTSSPPPSHGSTVEVSPSALQTDLWDTFGVWFAIWDPRGGRSHVWSQGPCAQSVALLNAIVAPELIERSAPSLLFETDQLAVIAIPVALERCGELLAIGAVALRPATADEPVDLAAGLLGMEPDDARRWLASQPLWTVPAALRLAREYQRRFQAETLTREREGEVAKLSENLASTYEEISLLYQLARNLRVSSSRQQLTAQVLDHLVECVAAESVGALLFESPLPLATDLTVPIPGVWLTAGNTKLDAHQAARLVTAAHPHGAARTAVVNTDVTGTADWPLPTVHSAVVVPIREGNQLYGWLLAIDSNQPRGFGSVEGTLMESIGSILGTHALNRRLYDEQAELISGVVLTMASAIDAKDPYTRGHSERVAEYARLLARELGDDVEDLKTIHMAGLLHDIGKIGVDDRVLRKTGRLTEEEFEQIKQHPRLGYTILCELKPLAPVLPAILHHHENWDGTGYPFRLAGDAIPRIARIVALADAYDAMTSDRPYRPGMSDEIVDRIIQEGAGKQWDEQVVAAYTRLRAEFRKLATRHRRALAECDEPD